MNKNRNDALNNVYSAGSPEEIAKHYDAWASAYDTDMAQAGYRHPSVAVALLTRHLRPGPAPVLDAGAGTGMVGGWLGILGYPNVEGLDISEGMLKQAEAKGGYTKLHRLALGRDLPFADGAFAAVISTGVFTTGHVGAEAMPELERITAAGGFLVLTVKEKIWAEQIAPAVEASAGLEVVEMTEPYLSMLGEAAATPGRAVVLRRL